MVWGGVELGTGTYEAIQEQGRDTGNDRDDTAKAIRSREEASGRAYVPKAHTEVLRTDDKDIYFFDTGMKTDL
jgi:hypothetical protein